RSRILGLSRRRYAMLTLLSRQSPSLVGLTLVLLPVLAVANHYPSPLALEDGSTIQITTSSGMNGADHYYIGATIGQNWSAMPAQRHVNYFTTGAHAG